MHESIAFEKYHLYAKTKKVPWGGYFFFVLFFRKVMKKHNQPGVWYIIFIQFFLFGSC